MITIEDGVTVSLDYQEDKLTAIQGTYHKVTEKEIKESYPNADVNDFTEEALNHFLNN